MDKSICCFCCDVLQICENWPSSKLNGVDLSAMVEVLFADALISVAQIVIFVVLSIRLLFFKSTESA